MQVEETVALLNPVVSTSKSLQQVLGNLRGPIQPAITNFNIESNISINQSDIDEAENRWTFMLYDRELVNNAKMNFIPFQCYECFPTLIFGFNINSQAVYFSPVYELVFTE